MERWETDYHWTPSQCEWTLGVGNRLNKKQGTHLADALLIPPSMWRYYKRSDQESQESYTLTLIEEYIAGINVERIPSKEFLFNPTIPRITKSIGQLTHLQEMLLKCTGVSEVPSEIGYLTNLERLAFNERPMTKLAEKLYKTGVINTMPIYLTHLPPDIGELRNLEQLFILSSLEEVPEEIGELESLEWLYLCSNKIKSLPESIGNLRNLKVLILYNNQLTELPESIGNLPELRIISASQNKLKTLPETMGQLTNLQILIVSDNELQELPPESIPPNLRTLSVKQNKLTYLPGTIGELQRLKLLDFRWNEIKSIHPNVRQLINCEEDYSADINPDWMIKKPFRIPEFGYPEDDTYVYAGYNPLDGEAETIIKELQKKGIQTDLFRKA